MVGWTLALLRRLVDGKRKTMYGRQREFLQASWDREEWDIALVDNDGNEAGGNIALYRIYRDLATGNGLPMPATTEMHHRRHGSTLSGAEEIVSPLRGSVQFSTLPGAHAPG